MLRQTLNLCTIIVLLGSTPGVAQNSTVTTLAGLVAHWPMDGTGVDISGNGNDLVVIGAAPGEDQFGTSNGALELNPATSSLTLPDGPATDLTAQFTWAGWVRFDRIGSAPDVIVGKSCCGANATTMFYADTYAWDGTKPNYNQIRFFVASGSGNYGFEQAGPILQNHTWYHIALVYDGPAVTMQVYVNGQLTNTLTNTGSGGLSDVPSVLNDVDAPLTMGRNSSGPTNAMQGALDDVWWFSRPLAASEIAALATTDTCAQQTASLQSEIASLTTQNSQLQSQLDTANTTVQSLQAQVTSLSQQSGQLQNALDTANAAIRGLQGEVATLTQQVQAATAGINAVQQTLQRTFNNPQFSIPGASIGEQTQNLAAAIAALNHGQLLALYKNLGGK